jgi:hypothetical protein
VKVFLSWSGARSREVANLLSEWLCCVIQAARPWVSTRDLDKGSLWFSEINDQLGDTTVGIICLTQENKARPWILFEAGALAKGLSTARVCTLLIDLEPKDIEDPLAQFNHTLPHKDHLNSLVKTINSSLGTAALDHRVLDQVFETYWPQFEAKFADILQRTRSSTPAKPRSKDEVLDEILETTRHLSSRMRRLESEIENERNQSGLISEKNNRVKIRLSAEQNALLEKYALMNNKGKLSDLDLKMELDRLRSFSFSKGLEESA